MREQSKGFRPSSVAGGRSGNPSLFERPVRCFALQAWRIEDGGQDRNEHYHGSRKSADIA